MGNEHPVHCNAQTSAEQLENPDVLGAGRMGQFDFHKEASALRQALLVSPRLLPVSMITIELAPFFGVEV